MFNQVLLENELSNRSNRKVRFSREVFYSPEDFVFFRKIIVDDKEINISVNLQELYQAHEHGRLEEQYEKIVKNILTTERE